MACDTNKSKHDFVNKMGHIYKNFSTVVLSTVLFDLSGSNICEDFHALTSYICGPHWLLQAGKRNYGCLSVCMARCNH